MIIKEKGLCGYGLWSKIYPMKKNKSSKGGIFFGFILFCLILVAIWYFLGMPKDADDVNQSLESVKTELKQVAESAAEEIQNVLKDNSVKETVSDLNKPAVVTKPKIEYSSEECDLNHPENSPLFFGNPSDSTNELAQEYNYLLTKPQFSISYNNNTLCPNWVGWHLAVSDLGDADRSNKFAPDTTLPAEWYAVTKNDYKYNEYGFDRGHICPSADRTATQMDNEITFLMTNMVPQAPDCNRIVWMHLESYERQLAKEGNELYIFAGPYGKGGIGAKGFFEEIPFTTKDERTLFINVPEYTWKIIMILDEGETDFSRVTEATPVLSVCVPNKQGCQNDGDWEQYLCTVDYIEELTGYDFFELLPDDLEDAIESKIYNF